MHASCWTVLIIQMGSFFQLLSFEGSEVRVLDCSCWLIRNFFLSLFNFVEELALNQDDTYKDDVYEYESERDYDCYFFDDQKNDQEIRTSDDKEYGIPYKEIAGHLNLFLWSSS